TAGPGFTDNFSAPGAAGQLSTFWAEKAGNFGDNGGSGGTTSAKASPSLAVLNGVNQADVSAEVDVALSAGPGQSAGLVARHSGAGFYLGLVSSIGATFTASIQRQTGSIVATLASVTVASATGRLRFQVVGSSLKLFLDDTTAGTSTLLLFAND